MKPILLGALPLCVCLAALPALRAETSVFINAGHSYETRMDAMSQGNPVPGWSTAANKRIMEYCLDLLTSSRIWDRGLGPRDQVVHTCRARSDQIIAQSPADGLAWAARAYIDYISARFEDALHAMEQSHAAAPEEMWIATRRVLVAEKLRPQMTPEQFALYESDLRIMAQTRLGLRILAQKYVRSTQYHAEITAAVESASTAQQDRFMTVVRRLRRDSRNAT